MRTFTIEFANPYTPPNEALFGSIVDDAGSFTPLIGRYGGVDFYCFHRLVYLNLREGWSSLDLHHSPAISREGAEQLGRLAREYPKEMMSLSGRVDLRTERTSIRGCSVRANLGMPLKLNREATVIRRLEGGNTYVRQVWGPGKLDMSWTEFTVAYSNGFPIAGTQQSGHKETVLEDAHIRATYVLDGNGVPASVFVGDIRDEDGRQLLFREGRQISGTELVLDARMAQPFADVDPHVWGDGRFEGQPLVRLEGNPAQFQAKFSPLEDVRLHGTTRSPALWP